MPRILTSTLALRRLGEFRRDLNLELVAPLTKEIASSWARVFESDLFGPTERSILTGIEKLIKEIERTSPAGLKDRCKAQGALSAEEAKIAMKALMAKVQAQMSNQQKEISRCVAPHVRDALLDGYTSAMEERGRGSVARQKALFHRWVEEAKDTVFRNLGQHILEKLDDAAGAIGKSLEEALRSLAEKVFISLEDYRAIAD